MATYDMEEFYQQYNKPHIGQITVGFSGIDPAPKSSFDFSGGDPTTPEAQAAQEFVQTQINNYMNITDINVDGGEITETPTEINVDGGEIEDAGEIEG